ncbi:hypothetical protein IFU40_06080 [Microbacterium sp. CFBP 13617]|uniref:hypothetical protein n=1 Tax=Microbacterium sp. CFBP 13617 TaxID=2774035 RepID=UPI00177B9504|nr:hypothetical protein [Microbacterium sp. CFBP 13617]MBD8218200.1 hypothetical protein [Microbacterium sp. CFBP 13617]
MSAENEVTEVVVQVASQSVADEAPHYFDRNGHRHEIAQPGENEPAGIPEGTPSREWTNAQLDSLAVRDGVDFTGVKNKSDRLKRIEAHRGGATDEAAADPALPAD